MSTNPEPRWSAEAAWRWYDARPWPLGFNYLPRTAVNFVEMWQASSFDAATVDQELAWAASIGFNSLRTNLPFIAWQGDRDGLLGRLERFLGIASQHGLSVMLCPLDDCEFSGTPARLGPQPGPEPGLHNSRAVGSPGRALVVDRRHWPSILDYVGDIVRTHRDDERVLAFDLYNEPGNRMIFTSGGEREADPALEPASHELLKAVFARAREEGPAQPLTTGVWHAPQPWEREEGPLYEHAIDRTAIRLSDIVSFHLYGHPGRFSRAIDQLTAHGRPVLCTEWMARQAESLIFEKLPILHSRRIGCYQWGLVRGRTQTHVPWPGVKERVEGYDEASSHWFHDLLEPDGTPHDEREVETIRALSPRC